MLTETVSSAARRSRHAAHCARAWSSTERGERPHQPGLLGERQELERRDQPSRGCGQRSSASTATISPVRRSSCGW